MTKRKQTKGWTEERRKAQAERCRANKPWKNATGPKTKEGKARASLNAFKHGNRCRVYDRLRYALRLNREFLRIASGALAEMDANELNHISKKGSKIKQAAHASRQNPPTK